MRASQGDGWPSAANNSAIVKHMPYHPAGPWLDHTNYGQVDDLTINIFVFHDKYFVSSVLPIVSMESLLFVSYYSLLCTCNKSTDI